MLAERPSYISPVTWQTKLSSPCMGRHGLSLQLLSTMGVAVVG
jgi:hypothetical protein